MPLPAYLRIAGEVPKAERTQITSWRPYLKDADPGSKRKHSDLAHPDLYAGL